MKKKIVDLTTGPITNHLIKLAIPIIGSSLMQMAYNLTDMMWLGKVGSQAVASVGSAGFFVWLGMSLLMITRIGAEVGVSQTIGNKDYDGSLKYARHALLLALLFSLVISLITYIFSSSLIGIFRFKSDAIEFDAICYLRIVSCGFIFTFLNPTFQGIYNGAGNSKLPFYYLLIGLALNIILDPILIFGFSFIPSLGVKGAAFATLISQALVFSVFFVRCILQKEIMELKMKDFSFNKEVAQRILKLGLPVALESGLFAVFALVLARMITQWGDLPIAVQSIGAQIEALSWMTSSGLATALGSFVGQNYGAHNWERIRKGYYLSLMIGFILGIIVSLIFVFFGELIFSLFLPEREGVKMGIKYLNILAISQVFMIIEIITRGGFNGIGKANPPSIIGVVFTGARIPGAWFLSGIQKIGYLGIWWAITISSIIKGVVSAVWFLKVLDKHGKD